MLEKMKKWENKYYRPIFIFFGICFCLFLWWLVAYIADSPLLVGPSETFVSLGTLFTMEYFYVSIGYSLLRLIIVLLVCFMVGGILGTLAGLFKRFYAFLYPIITILRAYPTVIILVVIVVLVNDRLSPYIIASFVLFPIIYEAFAKGINSVDDSISDSLEIDGGYHKPHNVIKVLLPLSFPYISLTITQTIGLGLKIIMMAELMNGNTSLPGLGNMIKIYQNAGEYNYIYAIATFVIMLTIIIDIGLYFLKKYIANKYSFNKK